MEKLPNSSDLGIISSPSAPEKETTIVAGC